MKKVSVKLRYHSNDERYVVIELLNTIEPTIGKGFSKKELDDLMIDRRNVDFKIVQYTGEK